jgi:hypothetical protein
LATLFSLDSVLQFPSEEHRKYLINNHKATNVRSLLLFNFLFKLREIATAIMSLARKTYILGGKTLPFIGKGHPDFIWKKHPLFGKNEVALHTCLGIF